MYRIVSALTVFMVLILFGMGSLATTQAECPNIEGVWDFDQTFIELCYTTPPVFTFGPPVYYAPGIVQGETDANPSGTPTYVRKTGTQEIFQDPNNNCLFWSKRVTTNLGKYASPPNPLEPPPELFYDRTDWYVGMFHGFDGGKITMRIIPNAGAPAARIEGKIAGVDRKGRPKAIEYLIDTDIPSPLCGSPGLTGADAGKGIFFNRR